jgi:predicted AAA+ superfamily ATPase
LIKKIAFYDLKGKNILRMKAKYYASDLGLLNHLNKNSNSIEGYKLENLIFLNLLEQGYEVYTAKDYQNNEIDFVCIKNFETVYIQVTTVLNNENFGRETAAFNKIKDGYSKIIICYENNSTFELNGIKLFTFNE